MEITIYRRHIKQCPHREDRYAPRCGCPLSGQFNWPHATTKFDGKKLKHGQNKWSLNARIWSEAQQNSTKLKRDLEAILEGKPVRKPITVEAAVQEWLEFKSKNGETITKPKLRVKPSFEKAQNFTISVRVMPFSTCALLYTLENKRSRSEIRLDKLAFVQVPSCFLPLRLSETPGCSNMFNCDQTRESYHGTNTGMRDCSSLPSRSQEDICGLPSI